MEQEREPRNPTADVLICFALVVVTLVLYWPVRHHGFINYDDPLYVSRNTLVKQGLTWHGLVWAFGTMALDNWFPMTLLSHMLDCELFGVNAGAHHLVNVAFHVVNAVVLYLVLLQLTGARWRSAAVAALFAWHPLQVGSVAWISERKNLLSTLFWLLTIGAYARYAEATRRGSGGQARPYVLALVCFALGLMSKPMLVTVPFTLLLLDFWPLRRFEPATLASRPTSVWRLVREKLPFFALAVAFSALTIWAQERSLVMARKVPLSFRVENALISYLRYVRKMFWPSDLAIFYSRPASWPLWLVLLAASVLAVVTVLLFRRARQWPWSLFGWLWFSGTMVPVIGLVPYGSHSMADRYMYAPMIGLFIAIAWSVPELARRWNVPRAVPSGVTVAVLIACAVLTGFYVQQWKDMETLLLHVQYLPHVQ